MESIELTDEEQTILDLRGAHEEALEVYEEARHQYRMKIAEYIAAGGSATHLARVLGVSRSLVYQDRAAGIKEEQRRRRARRRKPSSAVA